MKSQKKNLGGHQSRRAYWFRFGVCENVGDKKLGTSKMDRYGQELLDKQMRRLEPPENYGAIAVLLAATFLVGVAIGSVL